MSIFTLNKNIDRVTFEVSSDKRAVSLTSLDESIDDYRDNLGPYGKYMTEIIINVFAVNDESEKVMDIGFMRGIFFEAEVLFEDIGFMELCDMVSSDALGMAEAVTDRHGKINPSICQPEHNMMYIREIFIEEPCRGYGMGEYLLGNFVPLMSHALNLRPHACVVFPYPQEKTRGGGLSDAGKNAETNLPRLIAFYEKAGYIKLNGGEYMYKKHTDSLDELFEMLKG